MAGGFWDINTTTNWTDYLLGGPAKYKDGAAVYFDDVALGTTNVTLNVSVTPGSVTVTNNNLSYTITGSGKITGATTFTKQGITNLTLLTTNSYTGATTLIETCIIW